MNKNIHAPKLKLVPPADPIRQTSGGAAAGAPAGGPAAALPCLFDTTASPEENPPLPGCRKKQADALTENIKWLATAFGKERIGFLTLTLGDVEAGGRYCNLAEENIKELLGSKWAWKLAKLFKVTRFEVGEWQAEAVQLAILQHNLEVQTHWLEAGGNPARSCWWHVTEIRMDHLRPSPAWKKQMAELELAKECEAAIRKGLKVLAKKRQTEVARHEMLKEVADHFEAIGEQS